MNLAESIRRQREKPSNDAHLAPRNGLAPVYWQGHLARFTPVMV